MRDSSKFQCDTYLDEDEWKWKTRGDPVLHIELRKWADMILIAPLSANTLAKVSNGLCDNLLVHSSLNEDLHFACLGLQREDRPRNGGREPVPRRGRSVYEHADVGAPVHLQTTQSAR